jgi:hypothetical protein
MCQRIDEETLRKHQAIDRVKCDERTNMIYRSLFADKLSTTPMLPIDNVRKWLEIPENVCSIAL